MKQYNEDGSMFERLGNKTPVEGNKGLFRAIKKRMLNPNNKAPASEYLKNVNKRNKTIEDMLKDL